MYPRPDADSIVQDSLDLINSNKRDVSHTVNDELSHDVGAYFFQSYVDQAGITRSYQDLPQTTFYLSSRNHKVSKVLLDNFDRISVRNLKAITIKTLPEFTSRDLATNEDCGDYVLEIVGY